MLKRIKKIKNNRPKPKSLNRVGKIKFMGLVTATGGLALAAGAIGFSIAPAAWGLSCFANIE